VLLPSFLWICTRLLPFGEMEIWLFKNCKRRGVVLELSNTKRVKNLANEVSSVNPPKLWDQFPMGDSVSEN
jgi:hypothetical protein